MRNDLELGLVDHSYHALLSFGHLLEMVPPRFVEEVVFLGVDSTRDWVLLCKEIEWCIRDFTILPRDLDIPRDPLYPGLP